MTPETYCPVRRAGTDRIRYVINTSRGGIVNECDRINVDARIIEIVSVPGHSPRQGAP